MLKWVLIQASLSKSRFCFRLKGDSQIENCKNAIKIEGYYSTTFIGYIWDRKIENCKNAIKIEGLYQKKNNAKHKYYKVHIFINDSMFQVHEIHIHK